MSSRRVHGGQHLGDSHCHTVWDNSLPPTLRVAPGDTVTIETQEASGGVITPRSQVEDLNLLSAESANPVTGPIAVEGASPGDTLRVDILDIDLSGWGWSAVIPGFGLLTEDFLDPYLLISSHDSDTIQLLPDTSIATRPFPGTIGVAPAKAGSFPMIPPLSFCGASTGGNLDIPYFTSGSSIFFPVAVKDALFSVGDMHAAQGLGEVCGTAIESPMAITVRLSLEKEFSLTSPWAEVPSRVHSHQVSDKGLLLTTGVGSDLKQACREACTRMIELLVSRYRVEAVDAYILCSIAMDLSVGELVNAPNWTITASFPKSVFK